MKNVHGKFNSFAELGKALGINGSTECGKGT